MTAKSMGGTMLAEIFMLHLEAAARTRHDAIPTDTRFVPFDPATSVGLKNGPERTSVVQFKAKAG
jgi:hypothetical protein